MYKVASNDTFEIISRKQYGDETNADLIKNANPNAVEPLTVGTILNIPINPNSAINQDTNVKASIEDEVTILIENKEFKFFTEVNIKKSIDSIANITFSAPMESNNINFRNTFRPFSFKNINIYIGETLLFSGTMLNVDPSVDEESKNVVISAYSRCGVLNDCMASSNQYPIGFDDSKLDQITNSLIRPFGLKAIFKDSVGATFKRVTLSSNRKILNFLMDLAKKRNLVISSDKNGDLVFQKSIESGKLVAILEEGISPLVKITPNFNPQSYYTHITGLEPVMVGGDGSKYTVKNNQLNNSVRPFVFTVEDTENSDMKEAVNAKMSRMFGNMANYLAEVSTWRDSNGKLWEENTLIQVTAPDAMIYNSYIFLISDVSFNKDENKKSATLQLVFPQSFSGKIPEVLPWVE